MVKGGYRRRPRRRNNNRRLRGSGNAVRSVFRRRVQMVSNKPAMRPRPPGFNNLAISCVRRLISYPSSGVKPDPNKPTPASSWWLDSLKWSGSVALQLLGLFLTSINRKDPKAAQFAITGCGASIAFSPSDLLAYSPVAVGASDGKANCPFEQGRIIWIRAHISPSPDLGQRGGFYAAAFVPVQAEAGKIVIGEVAHDFDLLAVQPGSVIRPVTSPMSVSWSPTLMEQGAQWRNLGISASGGNDNTSVVLALAFSDMATDKAPTPQDEYRPARALMECHIDGRVEVRRPGYVQIQRSITYTDPTKVSVSLEGVKYAIPHEHITWEGGIGRVNSRSLNELDEYLVPPSNHLDLGSMSIE